MLIFELNVVERTLVRTDAQKNRRVYVWFALTYYATKTKYFFNYAL